jgi:hypothetical protein
MMGCHCVGMQATTTAHVRTMCININDGGGRGTAIITVNDSDSRRVPSPR